MQILALLAALGAMLGQPDDPPDQDAPAAEQPDVDADSYSPEEPAEQPETSVESYPAGEQPGGTGSDEDAAGLDEAHIPPREMDQRNPAHRFSEGWLRYLRGNARRSGLILQRIERRDERTFVIHFTVPGGRTDAQWRVIQEHARLWVCGAAGRETSDIGLSFILTFSDGSRIWNFTHRDC